MKLSILIIIFFSCHFTFAQINVKEIKKTPIQFSGIVVTSDSLKPIPFVNIIIFNRNKGCISDANGFFSFISYCDDTIIFSAVGLKKDTITIPDTLIENKYSLIQAMQTDTIFLAETLITPWPTYKQFKEIFIKIKIPDNDLIRAQKNLDLAELKEKLNNMPMSADLNYKNFMQHQEYRMSYLGLQPPSLTFNNPLLNPFAWIKFIEAWKNGDFKKK